jgi:hypothetical protein
VWHIPVGTHLAFFVGRWLKGFGADLSFQRLKITLENEVTHLSGVQHLLDVCGATGVFGIRQIVDLDAA